MAKNLKNVAPDGSDNLVDEMSENFDRFETWVIGNGKYLLAGCIALVVIVAVVFTVIAVRNAAAQADAEMFAKADTIESLTAALAKSPSAASAPEARFRLASLFLEKKDYAAAQKQFEELAKNTSDAFLAQKAALALGYLDELSGKQDAALQVFAGIADNGQVFADLRAEAAYAAGRICAAQKNFERARTYLSRFRPDNRSVTGVWGAYANALLRELPAPVRVQAAAVPASAPAAQK